MHRHSSGRHDFLRSIQHHPPEQLFDARLLAAGRYVRVSELGLSGSAECALRGRCADVGAEVQMTLIHDARALVLEASACTTCAEHPCHHAAAVYAHAYERALAGAYIPVTSASPRSDSNEDGPAALITAGRKPIYASRVKLVLVLSTQRFDRRWHTLWVRPIYQDITDSTKRTPANADAPVRKLRAVYRGRLATLATLPRSAHQQVKFDLSTPVGVRLLLDCLAEGACLLARRGDASLPTVRLNPSRRLIVDWQPTASGDDRIAVVEPWRGNALWIRSTPPMLLDPDTGALTPLETNIERVDALLNAPPLRESVADAFMAERNS